MSHFGFTTTELARLAKVERAHIYQSVAAHGEWRGIKPAKHPNGRLTWRRAHVFEALGLVPDDSALCPGVRAGVEILRRADVEITPEAVQVLEALLAPADSRGDHGVIRDITLLHELWQATEARIESQALVSPHYAKWAASKLGIIAKMIGSAVETWEGGNHD